MNAIAKYTAAASISVAVKRSARKLPGSPIRVPANKSIGEKAPTQYELALQALLQRPYTSDELHALGIYEPRSRIAELRKVGYRIATTLVAIVDRDGYQRTGVALYALEDVPCVLQH